MPPRRTNRHVNNKPVARPTPTSPMDPAVFQAAVTVAVAADMAQISGNGMNGNENGNDNENVSGNSTKSSNLSKSQGHQRICSYKEFMNCKPKTHHDDGEVVTLTRWFEKTESVFEICSCPDESKVKYASCTFEDLALLWWNGHVKTLTLAVANYMI